MKIQSGLNPLISVIISVYNAERYIEACVASVCAQTYQNLEIILVNDGSLDGSPVLCDALAQKDARIVVIHQANGGVSSARNAGIDTARGDYITFVDCDDSIEPEMYETLLCLLTENAADVAGTTFYEELPGGALRSTDTGKRLVLKGREAAAAVLGNIKNRTTHRMMIWFFVWNKLYRADLIRNIRFDPATDSAEDVPFNLRVFARAKKVVLLERPFYFWRRSNASLSNRHAVKALRGGANTSILMYRYAAALPQKYRRIAVTSAFRNMYWYYSFCVAEMHSARVEHRSEDRREYSELRDQMREMLKQMRAKPAYKFLNGLYKATVCLMIRTPRLFSVIWLAYRFVKRDSQNRDQLS